MHPLDEFQDRFVADVGGTCLDQADADGRILAQPRGQDAPRRATSRDDVIELGVCHCTLLLVARGGM
ncbi:unannotated protein [freshwater metagenome]|uniref:Unannotated protein n=1 Tax=freshwater metagenome TaxID=449393 RepID=A0A6J7GUI6_9ZZZZ